MNEEKKETQSTENEDYGLKWGGEEAPQMDASMYTYKPPENMETNAPSEEHTNDGTPKTEGDLVSAKEENNPQQVPETDTNGSVAAVEPPTTASNDTSQTGVDHGFTAPSTNPNPLANESSQVNSQPGDSMPTEKEPPHPDEETISPASPESPQKSSKGKTIGLVLSFVLLLAFIFFLPDIQRFVENWRHSEEQNTPTETPTASPSPSSEPTATPNAEAVSTNYTCTLNQNDEANGITGSVSIDFTFTNQLLKAMHSRSNYTASNENGEQMLQSDMIACTILQSQAKEYGGSTITCNLEENTLAMEEETNFEEVDQAAKDEAGITSVLTLDMDQQEVLEHYEELGYTCAMND